MPAHLDRYKFDRLPAEEHRALASAGGKAAHKSGRAHEFTPEEAREAGRKGGQAVSRDREHMSRIGKLGGRPRGPLSPVSVFPAPSDDEDWPTTQAIGGDTP